MLLNELLLTESKIKDQNGYVQFAWKSDLEEEEDEGYIPEGYSKKVLELVMIEVSKPGNGHGTELMNKFLASPAAKKAELIFLDPNPGEGVNAHSDMSEEKQVKQLKKFYSKFGFKSNPQSNRMWLVQKGSIPKNKLPT